MKKQLFLPYQYITLLLLLLLLLLSNTALSCNPNESTDCPNLITSDITQSPPLPPGKIEPIHFQKNGQIIKTKNLYRIGLPPSIRHELMNFSDRMGITEEFRSINMDPLQEGEEFMLEVDDEDWYMQRPAKQWHSNMHWISPGGPLAQENYLRALGDGGLDGVLEGIGEALGLDGLACFHLTFIGVTECQRGYLHYDFEETLGKAFNLIIPLQLVPDSVPELDVGDENDDIHQLKYQYDVGIMLGDEALHATSAVSYGEKGGVRIMATVYIADINEENVVGIMDQYTQAYPPADENYLLALRGAHWKRNGGAKMPRTEVKAQ